MKVKSTCTISFLFLLMFLFPANAFAQLFGADDEDLAKIELELKKFNYHLEHLKTTQIENLRSRQEDLLHHIEEIKQVLPQLLEAIDQNKRETLSSVGRTNLKISDLEAEVKNQILDKIDQQNKNLELFRQDMEKFEQNNKGIKAVLTQDLIPALRNENNKTRQSMLDEIEKLKFSQNRLEGKLDELLRKIGFEKLESWDIYK